MKELANILNKIQCCLAKLATNISDTISITSDQVKQLLQEIYNILVPQSNMYKKGVTTDVSEGDTLDNVIATSFNSVNLNNIKSICISGVTDLRINTIDSVKELEIPIGTSITWNEVGNNFIGQASFANFIFNTDCRVTITFEELI